MKKEIKEISDIISNHIEFYDIGGGSTSIDEEEVAKEIYNAGYHKIVWHKVADGDLPMKSGLYYCYCNLHYFDRHNNVIFDTVYSIEYFNLPFFDTINKSVIAWTELPKYEE